MAHHHRFSFSFVLTREEFENLMFQIGTLSSCGGRRKVPRVFTEHGAIMAARLFRLFQSLASVGVRG
ncbi:MAG: ORF6N domain-containing protein [Verrucomicrobiales bacterium]